MLQFNESLAMYFGRCLFVARPELEQIQPRYLPGGNVQVDSSIAIHLESAHDKDIQETMPKEVSRLFVPTTNKHSHS